VTVRVEIVSPDEDVGDYLLADPADTGALYGDSNATCFSVELDEPPQPEPSNPDPSQLDISQLDLSDDDSSQPNPPQPHTFKP